MSHLMTFVEVVLHDWKIIIFRLLIDSLHQTTTRQRIVDVIIYTIQLYSCSSGIKDFRSEVFSSCYHTFTRMGILLRKFKILKCFNSVYKEATVVSFSRLLHNISFSYA